MKRDKATVTLLFLLTAGLLGASIGLTYWTGVLALDSNQKLATHRAVIEKLEQTVSSLQDAEAAQRGFLLTGEERYLEPYTVALAKLRTGLSDLQRLVSKGALPAKRMANITDAIDTKRREMEETIRLRREQGLEATLPRVREGLGRQLMATIHAEVASLEHLKETEFEQAEKRAEHVGTAKTITFFGTAILNLIFLGWVGKRISGAIQQREVAVQESERQREFLATTLASIGDGVIVSDPAGQVTFLNPEAERLTGWTGPEAVGVPLNRVFQIVSEDSGQPIESPGDRALRLGTATGFAGRVLLIGRNGAQTPIDDSAAPVRRRGGPVLGVVLVFRDIRQQRQGQEAIERLAAIVESSEDAIFSNSVDGSIRTWNLGAQRMFGYTPEEIIGKSAALLLPPPRAREEMDNLERLRKGERIVALETIRRTRDGRNLDVSLTVSALKNEAGRIIGHSQIIRDITDRKQFQSELQRLNAELERRVTDRTRSLQEATEQLNAFCYSVAHDLQAPLRAQLAFSQVLLEDFGSGLGADGRDYVDRIAQSAARQGRLVRDLLAHVSLSRTDLPMEPVDLAKAVERVRQDLHSEIQNQRAAIHLGPLPGKVLANPSSLHLIITNLLSNALKFVRRGTAARVRIWSEQNSGLVRLWVEDKGIGIPPKYLAKIFGVFQRLHTIDEYPGTGIGLAIVKKAAERMSGQVGVESEPGVGSRFWVELRQAADTQAPPPAARDRVMLPTRGSEAHASQV